MEQKKYEGVVSRGGGTATGLGFPTVNIPLSDDTSGIYAAVVRADGVMHMAAVFADPKRKLLEAHLLDFTGDVYGKSIEIELCEKLRDPEYFETEEKLKSAIGRDVENVRAYFKSRSHG